MKTHYDPDDISDYYIEGAKPIGQDVSMIITLSTMLFVVFVTHIRKIYAAVLNYTIFVILPILPPMTPPVKLVQLSSCFYWERCQKDFFKLAIS